MSGRGSAAGATEEGQAGYQSSEDGSPAGSGSGSNRCNDDMISVQFMQKIFAEVLGTYFMIFAGCGSVVVNLSTNGTVTFPGICAVWGLVVMVLVYSVGHISGAHFNPAVTVAFATCGRFPWKQVPSYAVAQVLGSTLASLTLRVVFGGATAHDHFFGTAPSGTDAQAVVLEFVISFYLMFVVSGVATDNRAAHHRGINEPGADLGPGDRGRPVQKHLGLHGWADVRDGDGRVGLQPGPLHRQAAARDHQERLIPQGRGPHQLTDTSLDASWLLLCFQRVCCCYRYPTSYELCGWSLLYS
ncbi:aquaporin NIP1-2-like isoform X1 [Miscanthus floridulus]|uniref:aquaporin NIP1-2-like isoform X1 n=1 Tax=Miscanthus floridulus TaxID=154761 RepID=UPI003457CE50